MDRTAARSSREQPHDAELDTSPDEQADGRLTVPGFLACSMTPQRGRVRFEVPSSQLRTPTLEPARRGPRLELPRSREEVSILLRVAPGVWVDIAVPDHGWSSLPLPWRRRSGRRLSAFVIGLRRPNPPTSSPRSLLQTGTWSSSPTSLRRMAAAAAARSSWSQCRRLSPCGGDLRLDIGPTG
jgi:hypothetical protein